jgi:hypothetical protein
MDKMNLILIIVVIVLVGMLSAAFGYMFLTKDNSASNQTPVNVTNITNQTTNNTIPYSSEYITFTKAKSIAKSYAGNGVVTSDPILVKAKNGNAVYYSNYMYNGENIGGIIINAKTGAVISNEQYIPTTTTDNYNSPSDDYNSPSNDNNYDNNYDDGYYSDSNSTDTSG